MTDRPRALAVLIAVFLSGCIIGAGASNFWLNKSRDQARQTIQGFPSGPSPEGRQRMQELLQLTPEQESQFSKIMAESRRQMDTVRAQDQPKIEAIFSEQQPKIEAIAADTNRQVMSILNKDQQGRFESWWKEMGSRRRGPPHGGRETRHPPQQP
jgi:hypothetical protein